MVVPLKRKTGTASLKKSKYLSIQVDTKIPAMRDDRRRSQNRNGSVQSGDIWTLPEIIRQSGTKTVNQPIECVQLRDAIDIF